MKRKNQRFKVNRKHMKPKKSFEVLDQVLPREGGAL